MMPRRERPARRGLAKRHLKAEEIVTSRVWMTREGALY
jgi:hypothetical protein